LFIVDRYLPTIISELFTFENVISAIAADAACHSITDEHLLKMMLANSLFSSSFGKGDI
jgi:hypothetical protein